MTLWEALFYGLLQGLTEFLPVSSSGHLAIFQYFFGLAYEEVNHMLFNVLLHFATLLAVLVFYWRDVKSMALDFFGLFSKKNRQRKNLLGGMPSPRRLLLLLVVATLPLFVFVLFSDVVEDLALRPIVVGVALCVTGTILFLSNLYPKGSKDEKNASFLDVLCVGCMQGIATIPGLSRSGLTISTGLIRGFDRKFAIRFSFLMSIPAVLGATILQIGKAAEANTNWSLLPLYLAGMLVAAVVGYLALCLLRRLTAKGFTGFAVYCVTVGIIVIIASLLVQK